MNILILLPVLAVFTGCGKNDLEEPGNMAVEMYIGQLKNSQYLAPNLPEFTYLDIPALLKYREETQIITGFPHNGISSLYSPECTLGMYVLWTIESIRAVAIDSELLIARFPSQNPILALRNAVELQLVDDSQSRKTASKAYFDWWEDNKIKDFDDFKHIDPLAKTDYRWH